MTTTAITNVNVFDGQECLGTKTIVIEDGLISDKTTAEVTINGSGQTLLPGMIDAHAHLYDNTEYLRMCARSGVTTMLDMGNRDHTMVDRLRETPAAASVFSAISIAWTKGSSHWRQMGYTPDSELRDADDAAHFVCRQVERGADFIKMLLEDDERNDGTRFSPEIAKALVEAAHTHNKLVIAHAVTAKSYQDAIDFGVDEISHVPYEPLPPTLPAAIAAKGIAVVPTVVVMAALAERLSAMAGQQIPLVFCLKSLGEFHKAGVEVLVGTDSNLSDPFTVADVPYGVSIHDELAYFVEAGFTPEAALAAATSRPARFFSLDDRGKIAVGKRADLYLVRGNPCENINDIRNATHAWVAGTEVAL